MTKIPPSKELEELFTLFASRHDGELRDLLWTYDEFEEDLKETTFSEIKERYVGDEEYEEYEKESDLELETQEFLKKDWPKFLRLIALKTKNKFDSKQFELQIQKKLVETLKREEEKPLQILKNELVRLFKAKGVADLPQAINAYTEEYDVRVDDPNQSQQPFYQACKEVSIIGSKTTNKKVIEELSKEIERKETSNYEEELRQGKKVPTIGAVDSMNGQEFEKFLKKCYEKSGYRATTTKITGDQGADLIVENKDEKLIVQAKRYKQPAGNKAVQEAVAAIKHYAADRAIVICNNGFTTAAKSLARTNNVELVGRRELIQLIKSTK